MMRSKLFIALLFVSFGASAQVDYLDSSNKYENAITRFMQSTFGDSSRIGFHGFMADTLDADGNIPMIGILEYPGENDTVELQPILSYFDSNAFLYGGSVTKGVRLMTKPDGEQYTLITGFDNVQFGIDMPNVNYDPNQAASDSNQQYIPVAIGLGRANGGAIQLIAGNAVINLIANGQGMVAIQSLGQVEVVNQE